MVSLRQTWINTKAKVSNLFGNVKQSVSDISGIDTTPARLKTDSPTTLAQRDTSGNVVTDTSGNVVYKTPTGSSSGSRGGSSGGSSSGGGSSSQPTSNLQNPTQPIYNNQALTPSQIQALRQSQNNYNYNQGTQTQQAPVYVERMTQTQIKARESPTISKSKPLTKEEKKIQREEDYGKKYFRKPTQQEVVNLGYGPDPNTYQGTSYKTEFNDVSIGELKEFKLNTEKDKAKRIQDKIVQDVISEVEKEYYKDTQTQQGMADAYVEVIQDKYNKGDITFKEAKKLVESYGEKINKNVSGLGDKYQKDAETRIKTSLENNPEYKTQVEKFAQLEQSLNLKDLEKRNKERMTSDEKIKTLAKLDPTGILSLGLYNKAIQSKPGFYKGSTDIMGNPIQSKESDFYKANEKEINALTKEEQSFAYDAGLKIIGGVAFGPMSPFKIQKDITNLRAIEGGLSKSKTTGKLINTGDDLILRAKSIKGTKDFRQVTNIDIPVFQKADDLVIAGPAKGRSNVLVRDFARQGLRDKPMSISGELTKTISKSKTFTSLKGTPEYKLAEIFSKRTPKKLRITNAYLNSVKGTPEYKLAEIFSKPTPSKYIKIGGDDFIKGSKEFVSQGKGYVDDALVGLPKGSKAFTGETITAIDDDVVKNIFTSVSKQQGDDVVGFGGRINKIKASTKQIDSIKITDAGLDITPRFKAQAPIKDFFKIKSTPSGLEGADDIISFQGGGRKSSKQFLEQLNKQEGVIALGSAIASQSSEEVLKRVGPQLASKPTLIASLTAPSLISMSAYSGTGQYERTDVSSGPLSFSASNINQINKPTQRNIIQPVILSRPRSRQRYNNNIQTNLPKTNIKEMVSNANKVSTKQRISQKQAMALKFNQFFQSPNIPVKVGGGFGFGIPFVFKLPKTSDVSQSSNRGFLVQGRRYGKFFDLGYAPTQSKAQKIGLDFATKTLGVTYRVKGDLSLKAPTGFRAKKTKQGTEYIELIGRRLKKGSGEIPEIIQAKRSKKR